MVASVSMTHLIQVAVCFAILFAVFANSLKFEDLDHGRGLKNGDDGDNCGDKDMCFDIDGINGTRADDSCECAELCNSNEDCHEWCWCEKEKLCYIAETHRDIMELEGYYHGHQEAEEHEDKDHEDHDHEDDE